MPTNVFVFIFKEVKEGICFFFLETDLDVWIRFLYPN